MTGNKLPYLEMQMSIGMQNCCFRIDLSMVLFIIYAFTPNLVFMCVFCRSLFLLLSFFFCPLCCLFFFDLRILITALVSTDSSCS